MENTYLIEENGKWVLVTTNKIKCRAQTEIDSIIYTTSLQYDM